MKYFVYGFLLLALTASQAKAQSMAEMGEVMEAQTAVAPTVPTASAPSANTLLAQPSPAQTQQVASADPVAVVKQDSPRLSLFFSNNQLVAIMRANQGFISPKEAVEKTNQGEKPVDPGPRVLNLSGILYNGPKDWTIWFNGTRITPKNIPERILKLDVSNNRIQLKWFDIGNQRIINLTLYPHQQYNIDTNTILPSS